MIFHHLLVFFFFNDTATTEIYTLSLHDALPISVHGVAPGAAYGIPLLPPCVDRVRALGIGVACDEVEPPDVEQRHDRVERSEEHTSELQSPCNLVCRLLLEKKTGSIGLLVTFSR